MRFSKPSKRSRLRKPTSASIRRVECPNRASDIPILEVVVVFPTPPLPDVTTITRAINLRL